MRWRQNERFSHTFFQMAREKRLRYEFTRPLSCDHLRCKLLRWNYVMIIIRYVLFYLLGHVTYQNMTEQITENTRYESTHIAHANHTSPSFSDPFPPTRRVSFTWNPNKKQRRGPITTWTMLTIVMVEIRCSFAFRVCKALRAYVAIGIVYCSAGCVVVCLRNISNESQWKAETFFATREEKKMFFCSIPRNRSLQQRFSLGFYTLLRWKTRHWPMQRNNRSMSWSWIINNNL